MAIKRHYIELVKTEEVDGEMQPVMKTEDEFDTDIYFTPMLIPVSVTYEALHLAEEIQDFEKGKLEDVKEIHFIEKMLDFTVSKIYRNAFTKEEFKARVHGPDFMEIIMSQIQFVASGQQSDATKKFVESQLKKKKSAKKS